MSQWLVIRYRLVLENCSGLSDSFSNPESTNPEFNLRKWVLSFSFTVQRMIINKVTTFQKLEDSGFVMLSNELVKCLFFIFIWVGQDLKTFQILPPKGQLILKCLFGGFNFFLKMNKNTSHSGKNEFICSFFGRIHGLTICFRN